jgi:hypothetical protein
LEAQTGKKLALATDRESQYASESYRTLLMQYCRVAQLVKNGLADVGWANLPTDQFRVGTKTVPTLPDLYNPDYGVTFQCNKSGMLFIYK